MALMAYRESRLALTTLLMSLFTGIIFLIGGAMAGVMYGEGQLTSWYALIPLVGLGVAMFSAWLLEDAAREVTLDRAQYRYYRYMTHKTKENSVRMAKAAAKTVKTHSGAATTARRSPTDDMYPVR
jgi:hypothetical protein